MWTQGAAAHRDRERASGERKGGRAALAGQYAHPAVARQAPVAAVHRAPVAARPAPAACSSRRPCRHQALQCGSLRARTRTGTRGKPAASLRRTSKSHPLRGPVPSCRFGSAAGGRPAKSRAARAGSWRGAASPAASPASVRVSRTLAAAVRLDSAAMCTAPCTNICPPQLIAVSAAEGQHQNQNQNQNENQNQIYSQNTAGFM